MDKGTSPGISRGRGAAGTGENAWRGRGRGRGQNQRQENVNIELGHGRGRGGRGGTIGGVGGKPTPETQPQPQSTRGGRGWGTSNNMSRGRGLGGPITGKKQMEFMPSISRSSGLDKDGDSLKNFKVQEEYRAFIEEKLERVLGRRKTMSVRPENDQERKHRVEEQENVLILFRKLREGVSSSNRTDSFSHEVYERSLYLSIIFDSPKHTTAIIPALVDDLYPKSQSQSQTKTNSPFNHISQLISLIHHLTSAYPSQNLYYQQRQRLNSSNGVSVLPNETDLWLESLAKSLRTGNYHQFSILTRPETKTKTSTEISISTFMQLPTIKDLDHEEKGTKLHKDLAIQAFLHSLECLRVKAREVIWGIIRVGYRELWFDEDYDTTSWLGRSLCLGTLETSVSRSMDVKQWMANAGMKGQVHKKEDMEGRWIVVKPS